MSFVIIFAFRSFFSCVVQCCNLLCLLRDLHVFLRLQIQFACVLHMFLAINNITKYMLHTYCVKSKVFVNVRSAQKTTFRYLLENSMI